MLRLGVGLLAVVVAANVCCWCDAFVNLASPTTITLSRFVSNAAFSRDINHGYNNNNNNRHGMNHRESMLRLRTTPTESSFDLADAANDAAAAAAAAVALYQVTIEYCTGCRWGLRAFWMAQELLTTFADEPALQAVTLIPSQESGRFLVQCCCDTTTTTTNGSSNDDDDGTAPVLHQLWDRTVDNGFPEMRELKQLVRDRIDPHRFLGHSDSEQRKQQADETVSMNKNDDAVGGGVAAARMIRNPESSSAVAAVNPTLARGCAVTPHIALYYCTGCRWMLRAAYLAQELLSTFGDELRSVSLIPSRPPAAGGSFVVLLLLDNGTNSTVLWDRTEQGRFPETKELKQLVRDRLNPLRDLGHSDQKKPAEQGDDPSLDVEGVDDEEAEQARSFFGVA